MNKILVVIIILFSAGCATKKKSFIIITKCLTSKVPDDMIRPLFTECEYHVEEQ